MKCMKSQRGLTIAELVLALAIFSIVSVGVTTLVTRLTKTMFTEEQKLEAISEKLFLDQVISSDLIRSAPSLNFLKTLDGAGKEFFATLKDARCLANCSRNLKIDEDGEAFVLLLSAKQDHIPKVLEPSVAFDATPPPFASAGTVGGTLTFNPNKFKTALDSLWVPGQLLMFYSPIGERPANGVSVNMAEPARNISFLAMVPVSGSNLIFMGQTEVLWNDKMPFDPSRTLSTPEEFFMNLPSSGGSSAVAFVRPVELIRYRIVARPDRKPVGGKVPQSVVRESLVVNASGTLEWSQSWNIGDQIAEVEFFRDDLSIASISVRYKEQK